MNIEEKFKIGTVVYLMSDDRVRMTVSHIKPDMQVSVETQWFDVHGHLQMAKFKPEVLRVALA